MIDEIEELWKLADEAREHARKRSEDPDRNEQLVAEMREFLRLAKKLDEIANSLAARLPT